MFKNVRSTYLTVVLERCEYLTACMADMFAISIAFESAMCDSEREQRLLDRNFFELALNLMI